MQEKGGHWQIIKLLTSNIISARDLHGDNLGATREPAYEVARGVGPLLVFLLSEILDSLCPKNNKDH